MRYKLQMMDTDFGVGMFAALPEPNLSLNEMLDHLRAYPFDDHMHEFVLQNFGKFRTKKLEKLIKACMQDNCTSDPAIGAILFEACICHTRQAGLLPLFQGADLRFLAEHTPAIHIRSHLLDDQPEHRKWTALFSRNIFELEPLPAPDATGLKPLYDKLPDLGSATPASKIRADLEGKLPAPLARQPLEQTIDTALKVLTKADAFLGPAASHRASLSPVSRLRHWMVKTRTVSGRMANSLQGLQTCYGRGTTQPEADASYLMELAERFSSYGSCSAAGMTGYARPYPLTVARYSELTVPALNPADVRLEVPYEDQPLHWIEGHDATGEPVLVPAQFIFLFNNMDEQALFSALGSTGLASGNTLFEAKVSALTEVMERDCDAVMPFDPARCFRLEAEDETVAKLLRDYEECGIHVWFMDMTPEYGVPCYKAVVLGKLGDVNKGSGCGLNGQRAAVSAMTEAAYPFPGPPSSPAPEGLPVRRYEDLPDLSTGSAQGDVMVLEGTLKANGYDPLYVDLTRKDLELPVCRAVVPGLEIISDFDQYSRVSPRLLANHWAMFQD